MTTHRACYGRGERAGGEKIGVICENVVWIAAFFVFFGIGVRRAASI